MSYFRNLFSALFGRNPSQPAAPAPTGFESRERIATARSVINGLLQDERFEFRTIGAIVKAVNSALGQDMPVVWVEERLREIPARQAGGKPHLWGATDKVGASVRGYSY